jgi:ATP-dependent exoDNAse (exonuclease V) alpha subunit
MVDVPLMRALLKALPDEAALLMVGDADQLPNEIVDRAHRNDVAKVAQLEMAPHGRF